jgi:hypothetical protein
LRDPTSSHWFGEVALVQDDPDTKHRICAVAPCDRLGVRRGGLSSVPFAGSERRRMDRSVQETASREWYAGECPSSGRGPCPRCASRAYLGPQTCHPPRRGPSRLPCWGGSARHSQPLVPGSVLQAMRAGLIFGFSKDSTGSRSTPPSGISAIWRRSTVPNSRSSRRWSSGRNPMGPRGCLSRQPGPHGVGG